MRIAITGLANSGKTTIFNALTGLNLEITQYPTVTDEPHRGVVKVPDERVERLSEIFKPKKTTYATIEYIDYVGLTKGDTGQNRKVFDLIKDADTIVNVIRCFEEESVVHPLGSINPRLDAETIEFEMILGDLDLVEKRLKRMEQDQKKGTKPDDLEKKLLEKCRGALERGNPLRDLEFSENEQKTMKHLQFMSIKPQLVLLNVAEHDINSEKTERLMSEIKEYFKGKQVSVLALCGKIEMELVQLSSDEAKVFLDDLGITEPALNKLIRFSYEFLGLISFLTVVENKLTAWTITNGTNALKAAGKVHSDIERGFIKAEVVSYDDFISNGSISAVREKGLFRLEGKAYEVKDGDIINFRFNV